MKGLAAALVVTAVASVAGADEVWLRGGGKIAGEIVEERSDAVVLEVGPGRIALPRGAVSRIVRNGSDLGSFRQRAARLAHDDIAGWLALAHWARDRDLLTQAREAFEHVAGLDPGNEQAQRGLGRVSVGGRWLTADEANAARGLVRFEGSWLSPAERAAILEERAATAAARAADAEAAARVREAEARARAAEAEARRAEAEARQDTETDGGIPYPYVFGGGPIVYGPGVFTPPTVVIGVPAPVPPPATRACPPRPQRDGGGSRSTHSRTDHDLRR